jgi:hypothetical protein
MLAAIGLAQLDSSDLGDRIPLVGRLEGAGEKIFLLEGLGGELGIDAGTPEEEQFLDARLP